MLSFTSKHQPVSSSFILLIVSASWYFGVCSTDINSGFGERRIPQSERQWPPNPQPPASVSRGSRIYLDQPPLEKPISSQRSFKKQKTCADQCASFCHPINYEDDDEERRIYICTQLKPAEVPLKDRLFKEASWPWLLFLTALGASFLFCCVCVCWSCCCRRAPESARHEMNGAGMSNGVGVHFIDNGSREPLANMTADRRIEEIITSTPLQGNKGGRNGGELISQSGVKYVADV